jgi:hypothetical protein
LWAAVSAGMSRSRRTNVGFVQLLSQPQLDRELGHLATKQDVAKVPERFEGKADFTMSFRLKDFFSAFVRCLWDPATLLLVERH